MKKLASLLVLAVVLVAGCASNKSGLQSKTVTFDYEAITRGSSKTVTVDEKVIKTQQALGGKQTMVSEPLDKAKWNAILAAAEKVNLDGLETLKRPSTKSYADAAYAARLKVTVDGKEYTSAGFDHGNPPAEIKELVTQILSFSDIDKKAENED